VADDRDRYYNELAGSSLYRLLGIADGACDSLNGCLDQ
jgi:hypothetical protein